MDNAQRHGQIVRSHDLSGVGQAPHHWGLSRQEKDRGSFKAVLVFHVGRNT
jgi:hypothetical protein